MASKKLALRFDFKFLSSIKFKKIGKIYTHPLWESLGTNLVPRDSGKPEDCGIVQVDMRF